MEDFLAQSQANIYYWQEMLVRSIKVIALNKLLEEVRLREERRQLFEEAMVKKLLSM